MDFWMHPGKTPGKKCTFLLLVKWHRRFRQWKSRAVPLSGTMVTDLWGKLSFLTLRKKGYRSYLFLRYLHEWWRGPSLLAGGQGSLTSLDTSVPARTSPTRGHFVLKVESDGAPGSNGYLFTRCLPANTDKNTMPTCIPVLGWRFSLKYRLFHEERESLQRTLWQG